MKYVHYSKTPLKRIYNVCQSLFDFKPVGLWFSIGDNWAKWCRENEFGIDSLVCQTELFLDLKQFLCITNPVELRKFHYTYATPSTSKFGNIDWSKVSTQYDGIIIAPYLWECRFEYMWYYGWDCASGCVWNARSIKRKENNFDILGIFSPAVFLF